MAENIALYLASRQKRHSYWLERFKTETLPSEHKSAVEALLKEYASTIGHAARCEGEEDRAPHIERLKVIDRQLYSLFEARRLLTSELGIAAVTDCSTRGTGGSEQAKE